LKAFGFRGYILFFFLKEKEAKRIKKRAVLSLCHFYCALKLLAPPRAPFLPAQKLPGTAAHFYVLQNFCFLQSGVPP
jgi:hypothetical protein